MIKNNPSLTCLMVTNVLKALINISNYGDNNLKNIITPKSRGQPYVNLVGEPLDFFVRDSLCNTFSLRNIVQKKQVYDREFSYYGSQNHPPDIIIKNSDAIEVKKVGLLNSKEIQLNSSCPKSKLKSNSNLITQECRDCEPGWTEKDLIYTVGHVIKDKLKLLVFVYGDCYAANNSLYEDIRNKLTEEIKNLNLPFSETTELGRLNGVDPLKITNLRIRGMWTIKTPINHFSEFIVPERNKNMNIFCIMNKDKFDSFPNEDKKVVKERFNIKTIKIKDPNNPERKIDVILISFSF